MLTADQMCRIHDTVMEILRDPGLEIEIPEALLSELGDHEGVRVDIASRRVRLSPEPVLETIRQVSGAAEPGIDENGSRKPDQPLRAANGLKAMIGAHYGMVFDAAAGDVRATTHDDVRDFIKLRQALPDVVRTNIGLIPLDTPKEVAYVRAAALSAVYQGSRGVSGSSDLRDAAWIKRVMQAAGLWQEGARLPHHIWTTPPLRLCDEAAKALAEQARAGELAPVHSTAIMGGSGPITIAGTLAVSLAEIFGFNTISRLLCAPPNNEFRARSIGPGGNGLIDPRKGEYSLARPEVILLRRAFAQMIGGFYKCPKGSGTNVYVTTDATVPGIQAAMQKALCLCSELFHGFYSYDEEVVPTAKPIGTLQSETYICAEQVVIDHEMVQWLERYVRGIRVDDEALALDAVREVGPGGVFLGCEHTGRHFRDSMRLPELPHMGAWQAWIDSGRQSLLDKAKTKVREILASPLEPALPDDRVREVEKVVQEAERDLVGAPTGVRL